MVFKPSSFSSKVFALRKLLYQWRSAGTAALLGFIVGVATNLATDEQVTSFGNLIDRVIGPPDRPLTGLIMVAAFGFVLFWIVEPILALYCRNKRWEVLLAELARSRRGRSISSFSSGTLAWGECLTLQACPDITQGWKLSEIVLRLVAGRHQFILSPQERALYNQFREENKDKRWYTHDGPSYRLMRNPICFTDSPDLILEVQECLYSQVRYTNLRIAMSQIRQQEALKSILQGEANFAHTFVIHAIVFTSDNLFLATLSSPKKDFFGNCWSISIEEQLNNEDMRFETVTL